MELNIKDIGKLLKKSWIIIFLLVFVSIAIGAALNVYVLKKQYSASAMIMVGYNDASTQNGQSNNNMSINDYDLNVKLVDSYTILCKSDRILNQVIKKLNLNLTPKKLAAMISVGSEMDTDIIKLSVTDTSPQFSMDVTNTLVEVFKQEVTSIMKIDNVQVIDYATMPFEPVSPNVQTNLAISFIIGFLISIIIAFIRYYFDDTIKNENQITARLNIPVIGSYPKI